MNNREIISRLEALETVCADELASHHQKRLASYHAKRDSASGHKTNSRLLRDLLNQNPEKIATLLAMLNAAPSTEALASAAKAMGVDAAPAAPLPLKVDGQD